jgi:hypothetical protein
MKALICIGIAVILCMSGCTYIKIGDARYISFLQKSNGNFEYDPTSGTVRFDYSKDSDTAIEAIKEGIAIGAAAAKP